MKTIINAILRYRVLCLVMVAIITALAFPQLSKLEIDNSNESFFQQNDQTKVRLEEFKETFGNDDFIFILIDTKQPIQTQHLNRIKELVRELNDKVPYLDKITWIGNVESITGQQDTISIKPLIDNFNLSQQEMQQLRDSIITDPAYHDRLIAKDGNTVGILLEFINYPGDSVNPRKETPPIVEQVVVNYPDLTTYIVGAPVMSYQIDADTAQEGPIWLLIALIAMACVLAFTTRSVIGVVIPLITVFIAIIWTMALVAIFGFKLNMLIIMLPTLLLCVGIGDTMHVIAEFRHFYLQGTTPHEAIQKTLAIIYKPLILTTVTTAVGYLSFVFTDLIPLKELGFQAALGAFIALLVTFIFALPLLSFTRLKPSNKTIVVDGKTKRSKDFFDRSLILMCKMVLLYPKSIIIGFTIAILLAVFGLTQLKIETAFIHDLPTTDPLRQSFEFVDERMGGSMSIEFMVKTHKEDGVKELATIADIEKLQHYLNSHPMIMQTSSFLDQLKQMNRAVHENQQDFYKLPLSQAQVAEYLLLYESGGGKLLDQFVSFSFDMARIQARTKSLKLTDIQKLENDVNHFVQQQMPNRIIEATGGLSILSAVADYLAWGQLFSFTYAFIAIAIVMSLALRSIKLGLIAMVPNLLPILFSLGLMGLTGAKLNMIMVTLAPLILGVSIDDTIHFFSRYQYYFKKYGCYKEAYLHTVSSVGRVLFFTTLVISAGFIGFAYTKYDGPFIFALISIFAYSTALVTDFLVTPLLFSIFKPLGAETQDNQLSDKASLEQLVINHS